MNEPVIFNNPQFGQVRALEIDGEPWFVGKDVAEALGYSNTKDALARHVDPDDKMGSGNATPSITDSLGREQQATLINESGLYSLIMSSKLPTAKEFKHWVTSEVLPSIRKHGAYITPAVMEQCIASPEFGIGLLQALKAEQDKRKALEVEKVALEGKIEADRPKTIFADAVTASDSSILVGELAKFLRQNGIKTGQNKLFEQLRNEGYLIRGSRSDKNIPSQRSMELGLFEIKMGSYVGGDGTIHITKTPKVTGKGQMYFLNKYLKQQQDEQQEKQQEGE